MPTSGTLAYDVFVADPIPQNVTEPVPNGDRRMFSPLSVTLVHGERDAVLVDPPLTTAQAEAVGDWVAASGKNLTHIFATHGHGDHWFTAGLMAERFGAAVVASEGTIKEMHRNAAIRPQFWDKLFPGQIPDAPVTAVTVPGNRLTLEGHELHIVEVGHSDTDGTSVLHVPDLGLVVAGDVIYNGVHQYLAESADGGRDAWRKAITVVEDLRPRRIVTGHKNKELDDDAARAIAETRAYLDAADELLARHDDPLGFFHAMLERFPERLNPGALWGGAVALYKEKAPAPGRSVGRR
ncbi:MBL fold metallo-hydrolase [Streptomyces albogriseolus]|uniref:MBL fold metallo-hydrolase n=1 Tax=Streptomyces albogriseolus TaxID=1887 RepID=UPI00225BC9DC|nr:MBL fold metallo-hydrolase [Streptomyces viridodiastaticus]MCP9994116.1 MBL fold metallo-hydrolase [Streptomyces albogriseolus]MCX4618115.1 MBL fold metallo-hydrolase [Streptomyces viridodiastaticus]